jgi:hypothetical protein
MDLLSCCEVDSKEMLNAVVVSCFGRLGMDRSGKPI